MISWRSLPRSVQPAAVGFLSLTALTVIAAVAHQLGLLDASLLRRVLGMLVGMMAIVTGNYIPKMRPLDGVNRDFEMVSTAERTAGWILMLLGAFLAALFAFAPLDLARSTAPLVALIGLALIAGNWIWVALMPRSPSPPAEAGAPSRSTLQRRNISVWLLFAFAYVLIVLCLKMLADGTSWSRELAIWSVLGFTFAQALLTVVLERRPRSRSGGVPPVERP